MWTRRHSLTTKEWLEAGPILLGMVVAELSEKGGGEAALAIGENAFRAGYKAGEANGRLIGQGKRPWTSRDESDAWSAYEPPEDIKELA